MATRFTRGQIMGRSATQISWGEDIFEALENTIVNCQRMRRGLPVAMDRACRFCSYAQLGFGQKRAAGPVDPEQARPELAWRIPVRRISGRYFFGWKVKRVGMGWWQFYNDSREAFYIEYGIHTSPRAIRRPVHKLSFIDTLRFLEGTKIWDRVWANLVAPPLGLRSGKAYKWVVPPTATPIIGPIGVTVPGVSTRPLPGNPT